MRKLYSVPALVLVACFAFISYLSEEPQGWLDFAREISVAMTLFASVCVFYIFYKTRHGLDRIPPMAFGLLLFLRAYGQWDFVGDPNFRWYAWPGTMVVDLMVIYFVFRRYGDVRPRA